MSADWTPIPRSVTSATLSACSSDGALYPRGRGEEVVIARRDKPVARLVPVEVERPTRKLEHCLRIQHLPFHHKVPYERILIAQALEARFAVIGSDERFDAHGVRRVW